ncbi:MAG TPA: hypothetical protein DDZ96_11245 [Porphyromonadaceae bacterium]|jgi:hypothetical protein|nr:hypothetical protein [Porphyromonadaceae bacterium]HBL34374.1 hypothetical protein [Porphyromonadaceae bacterium]HBX19404.1 hypothetical protein [Porphyromonadaceae bacterium]HCM21574.1 hypothetical protein [Porphyromonadaceae bacterium]
MKIKISILREKIIGHLMRILHLLSSPETMAVFRTESVYCPVTDCMPVFSLAYCSRKKPTFPLHPVKHNKPLSLLGKNNLDSSAAAVFIDSGGCSPVRKTIFFPF